MSDNIRIEDVDKNFKVNTKIEKEDVKFYDAEEEPFRIYGVFNENGKFRRLPENVAKSVNDGVVYLHSNTAGGRIRFITNSKYIAIHALMNPENLGRMSHFPLTASTGFDMYIKEDSRMVYKKTFIPPYDVSDTLEGIFETDCSDEKEITINMPLYSDVLKVYIGLEENAEIKMAPDYSLEKPIVFYGSSITQGGCSSRPGNCYQGFIERELDVNYVNLGFSGSAKGEVEITDYIKNLDMSIFVLDYDHNAPTPEHLEATHEKMFKSIREACPDLPIIIMQRPVYNMTTGEKKRYNVLKKTYDNAVASGDKNVYFIDHRMLMNDEIKEQGTVDGCHPNDLGFFSMAKGIIPVIKEILGK